MNATFLKAGVLVVDGLLKEASTQYPVAEQQNPQMRAEGNAIDQSMLANNPEYYSGLKAAYNDYLGGLGSTAAEKAPKVVSVAK